LGCPFLFALLAFSSVYLEKLAQWWVMYTL
jgi:hypothetical protein